jgi:hypothetical protein
MDDLWQLRLAARFAADRVHIAPIQPPGGVQAREEPKRWTVLLPILPQQGQEFRGEHDAAVLLPFPLANSQHHPRTLDVLHLQVTEFGDPQARGIEGGQDGAGFESAGGLKQGRDFRLAENRR